MVELPAFETVRLCFQPGRRRVDVELMVDIASVLLGTDGGVCDAGMTSMWRQACQVALRRASDATVVSATSTLPPELPNFSGRRDELDRVLHLADRQPSRGGGAAVVVTIEGMPGIGKTQLAIRIAHELTRRAGLGSLRLMVNLRGFDPDRPPADPSAALDVVLRLLGVPGHEIQHRTLSQRVTRYGRALAGKPAVIILDDAAGEDQVRPLVPACCPCLVLVTSRRALDLDAALYMPLDLLSIDEATAYLRRTLASGRVDAEPQAAARIVHLCGRLPLDLAVTAAHARHRHDWSLLDQVRRLESLPRDEAVRPAFAASYGTLPAQLQREFRLLALHPGDEYTPAAAAALADIPRDTAHTQLRQLRRENLLYAVDHDRYRMHDLLRAYARRLSIDEDPHAHRQAALRRLLDHYLGTAGAAMDLLYPSERTKRPRVATPAPGFDEHGARDWLDQERTNLLALATQPAAHDWPDHIVQLATTLHGHLDLGAHYADTMTLHDIAIALARREHHPGLAQCLTNLGNVHWRFGQYHVALDLLEQALAASHDTGNRRDQAQALLGLGNVHSQLSNRAAAIDCLTRAAEAFRDLDDRDSHATVLTALGYLHVRTGNHRLAAEQLQQAVDTFRAIGNRDGQASALTRLGALHVRLGAHELADTILTAAYDLFQAIGSTGGQAFVLNNLGAAHAKTGDHANAFACHNRALTLYTEIGGQQGQADALTRIGQVHQLSGQHRQAAHHHRQALAIYRKIHDQPGQAAALNGIGETALATGYPHRALTAHTRAHQLACEAGSQFEQARAHTGLAHAHDRLADRTAAEYHRSQAAALYLTLGIPTTAQSSAGPTDSESGA